MINCEQCGGSGQAGPSFEEQFPCTKCNGLGIDANQIIEDLKWAMLFVRDIRYTEQKQNKQRILNYLKNLK